MATENKMGRNKPGNEAKSVVKCHGHNSEANRLVAAAESVKVSNEDDHVN